MLYSLQDGSYQGLKGAFSLVADSLGEMGENDLADKIESKLREPWGFSDVRINLGATEDPAFRQAALQAGCSIIVPSMRNPLPLQGVFGSFAVN